MSVRVGDRSEGKLQVLRVARDLCTYTLKTCKSEKNFPKSQRWIMTQTIVNECLAAYGCIRRANKARNDNDAEKVYRFSQQMEAGCHLDALLSFIDLAYDVFSLESKTIEYWTSLVDETERLLSAWTKSEKRKA